MHPSKEDILLIFVRRTTDLVDTYLMFAASAIAANTVARSACGAAAPLFTEQMFTALGVGPGGSLIGGVGALLALIPFCFYKYGERIRTRSRFAPTGPKKDTNEEDDAEKGRAAGTQGGADGAENNASTRSDGSSTETEDEEDNGETSDTQVESLGSDGDLKEENTRAKQDHAAAAAATTTTTPTAPAHVRHRGDRESLEENPFEYAVGEEFPPSPRHEHASSGRHHGVHTSSRE